MENQFAECSLRQCALMLLSRSLGREQSRISYLSRFFYAILMALHDLATRKVAKESLDRVQVGVYVVYIAGCSMLEWPDIGFFYDI